MATKGPIKRDWEKRPWSPSVAQLLVQVCAATGVKSVDLETTKRHKHIAHARFIAWKVLRIQGKSFPEAGYLTGGFDHSTVISGLRRISNEESQIALAIASKLACSTLLAIQGPTSDERETLFRDHIKRWHAMCAADIAAQKLGSMT